jgi:L-type amino acid transporter 9
MSLPHAVYMIAGSIIGSGIFFTPTKTLEHTGSALASLCVWIAAGAIALGGGLCYSELGSSIPESGGEYVYLLRAYGSLVSFLYLWTAALVARPLSLSIIVMTFAKYVVQPFYTINCPPPRRTITLVGIVTVIVIGVLNIWSVKGTIRLMNAMFFCKVAAIIGTAVMGLYWAVEYEPEALSTGFMDTNKDPSGVGLAFYAALWAYTGWSDLNYVAEEVKNPHKNVPRAIAIGVIVVMVCYITINLAYLITLKKSEFTDELALVLGEKVLGKAGLIIMPLFVAASTLGSATSSCMTASRVLFASGRQGHLPKAFALLHKDFATPVVSILTMMGLSIVCIAVGTLESLVNAFSFIAWTVFLGTFLSIYVLQRKEPHLKRPFKVKYQVYRIYSSF